MPYFFCVLIKKVVAFLYTIMYIDNMEDKKQEKLVFGVRLRSLKIKRALDAVVKKERKKYPHRGITRNQIVERAIERYIDYYKRWNK